MVGEEEFHDALSTLHVALSQGATPLMQQLDIFRSRTLAENTDEIQFKWFQPVPDMLLRGVAWNNSN
jgi:hypothetical protein